ncbi:MAG TPA: hypothetical protein VL241_03930 [Gemmatimonadales bacterium]|nr:hypothetical protein [Gemmatimonadales bacterium]
MLAACSGSDLNSPASPDLLVQSLQSPSQEQLDQQIPGFGGFYVDPSGTPTVFLMAGANRAPAEQALGAFMRARGLTPEALRVVTADYSYRQLETWYHRASPEALAVDGSVFADNDESVNRLRIGVEDLSAQANVNAALTRLGIPAAAVVVQHSDPIVLVSTLQNVVDRPVRAGVQINFPGFLCSVGFNATSGAQKSFITASHCTNTQGGTESTPYWQPLQSVDGTQIATEVDDPAYQRGVGTGCPRSRRCRYSDASRAAYVNGANQALGLIAATSGPNNGSLTITGSFTITADDCTNAVGGCLTVGTTVNKVGRTTGWTSGVITNTCVNTGVSGSNIMQLCQTFVSAGVGGGDSGSDVFQIISGTNVKLAGDLWGGNSNGTQFVFSPLANIVQELGPLTTH